MAAESNSIKFLSKADRAGRLASSDVSKVFQGVSVLSHSWRFKGLGCFVGVLGVLSSSTLAGLTLQTNQLQLGGGLEASRSEDQEDTCIVAC